MAGLLRRVAGWLPRPDPPLEDEPAMPGPAEARSLYLGPAIQPALRFEGGDPWRAAVLGVPALATFADIAALAGLDERRLAWLCYQPEDPGVDHYHRFTIAKRNGGERQISAPKPDLRAAQRTIAREILAKVPLHDAATAYRPGASIVANARRHSGRAVVIRLDIADFFPAITRKRVKGLFASFGYNEGVATVLALLTTDWPRVQRRGAAPLLGLGAAVFYDTDREPCLPQGSPTSPALANIVCRRLDARLDGLARKHGFAYTRYADDMIFSHPDAGAPVGRLIATATHILDEEGFRPNPEKARVTRAHQRQIVTGLVVNAGVAVPRADLRRFRAVLHQAERDGFEAASLALGKDVRDYARGYLAFVQMVDLARAERLRARHPWTR